MSSHQSPEQQMQHNVSRMIKLSVWAFQSSWCGCGVQGAWCGVRSAECMVRGAGAASRTSFASWSKTASFNSADEARWVTVVQTKPVDVLRQHLRLIVRGLRGLFTAEHRFINDWGWEEWTRRLASTNDCANGWFPSLFEKPRAGHNHARASKNHQRQQAGPVRAHNMLHETDCRHLLLSCTQAR